MPTVRTNKGKPQLKLLGREASDISGAAATCAFISNNFPEQSTLGKLARTLSGELDALQQILKDSDAWPNPVERKARAL